MDKTNNKKEYYRKWRENNPTYHYDWQLNNQEKVKQYSKDRWERIKQEADKLAKAREMKRIWAKNNRMKMRIKRIKQELEQYESEVQMLKFVKRRN